MNNSRIYPPSLPGAVVETYKTIDDVEMKVWIFAPDGHSEGDSRPAIVFFFGGGWRSGSPGQFARHCDYLTDRGMVAITADYGREGNAAFVDTVNKMDGFLVSLGYLDSGPKANHHK